MTAIPRHTLLAGLLATAAVVLLCAAIGPQSAQSASYRKCVLSSADQDPPGDKPTYNYDPKALNTSCTIAVRVMRSYQGCRSKTGVSCAKKLLGRWSCTGRITSKIAVQFNADFTCKAGNGRIRGSFSQNT